MWGPRHTFLLLALGCCYGFIKVPKGEVSGWQEEHGDLGVVASRKLEKGRNRNKAAF